MRPTYYVRHPDDSYSVANPQPTDSTEVARETLETLKALKDTLTGYLYLTQHPVNFIPQPAYPFLGTLFDTLNADGTRTFTMQQASTITDPLGLVSPEGLSDKAIAVLESAAQDH